MCAFESQNKANEIMCNYYFLEIVIFKKKNEAKIESMIIKVELNVD